MYRILDADLAQPRHELGGLPEDFAEILRFRQHIMERGEHLYCAVLIRSLVETEIPRPITLATDRSPV